MTTLGGLKCWGFNFDGEVGIGTTTISITTPQDVTGLTSGVAQVAASINATCARTLTGGMKCWGRNGAGEVGDGTTIMRTTPVDVVGLASGVAAIDTGGGGHTCALLVSGGSQVLGRQRMG